MNTASIIKHTRSILMDIAQPYMVGDDEMITYLNEAIVTACRSSYFLTSTDNTVGEIKSSFQLTIDGNDGSISSIKVGIYELISNTVNYTTSQAITAQLLANEINSKYTFLAVANGNILTITSPDGTGEDLNNLYPVVTGNLSVNATQIIGGINGICKISIKPNKLTYDISDKIIKINKYTLNSNGYVLKQIDHREMCGNWKSHSGNPTHIVTGENYHKITLNRLPTKTDTVNLTVTHLPLKDVVKMTDIPCIPEQWHIHLCDYILYKCYSKADSELKSDENSEKYRQRFVANFGAGETTTADMQTYRNLMIGNNIDGLY